MMNDNMNNRFNEYKRNNGKKKATEEQKKRGVIFWIIIILSLFAILADGGRIFVSAIIFILAIAQMVFPLFIIIGIVFFIVKVNKK